jgi:hypothetical protein
MASSTHTAQSSVLAQRIDLPAENAARRKTDVPCTRPKKRTKRLCGSPKPSRRRCALSRSETRSALRSLRALLFNFFSTLCALCARWTLCQFPASSNPPPTKSAIKNLQILQPFPHFQPSTLKTFGHFNCSALFRFVPPKIYLAPSQSHLRVLAPLRSNPCFHFAHFAHFAHFQICKNPSKTDFCSLCSLFFDPLFPASVLPSFPSRPSVQLSSSCLCVLCVLGGLCVNSPHPRTHRPRNLRIKTCKNLRPFPHFRHREPKTSAISSISIQRLKTFGHFKLRAAHFFRPCSTQSSVLSPQSSVLSPQPSVLTHFSLVSLLSRFISLQTRDRLSCLTFFRRAFFQPTSGYSISISDA